MAKWMWLVAPAGVCRRGASNRHPPTALSHVQNSKCGARKPPLKLSFVCQKAVLQPLVWQQNTLLLAAPTHNEPKTQTQNTPLKTIPRAVKGFFPRVPLWFGGIFGDSPRNLQRNPPAPAAPRSRLGAKARSRQWARQRSSP